MQHAGFPDGSDGEESACSAGDPGSIPSLGRSLEKEMAPHSSVLAWRSPWIAPGQNTKVGSYSLLQGIFSTQGSNSGLLHRKWILYQLNHHRIHEEDRNTVSQHRLRNTDQSQHHTGLAVQSHSCFPLLPSLNAVSAPLRSSP